MKMNTKPWVLNTEFLKALEEKDVVTIHAILDAGFDIDSNILLKGRNALSICISNGWHDMTQLLVSRGCSLSLTDPSYGTTALMLAVQQADALTVQLLLENRADPTWKDYNGETALHFACEMNNLRIAQIITGYADKKILHIENDMQRTPFAVACRHGSVDLIRHLLSLGSNVNTSDFGLNSPLLYATYNEHCTAEMIALLLDAGADIHHVNHVKDTPLLSLLRNCSDRFKKYTSRYQEICNLLIERGCDINAFNGLHETALQLAVILNDETLVHKLLNRGANVNAMNKLDHVPLYYACRNGSLRMVSLLLEGGADPRLISESSRIPPYFSKHLSRTVEGGIDNSVLLIDVIRQSKECPTLRHLCRCLIRKILSPNLEKSSSQLPLPPYLVNYIQLLN